LNDVVIDYDRGKAGYAFISDSGARGPNGIIVVDLDSGRSWRRLSGDPSVRAAQTPGFELKTVDGQARNSTGIDGIALSPDARTLWWTPLGSYELYSIATDALVDESIDALALPRHVARHEPRRFATDGLDCDRQGRLYLTDGTNGTLQRYLPDESRYEMLLHGSGYFVWPDSIKLGPDRIVYVTDSQVSRLPAWTGGVDRRQPPFTLYRAAIDGDPAQY
jgi:sugar lactone lactonase YvrE